MEPGLLSKASGLDVVASVPYQLGFKPEDSIVVIGIRPPTGRLGMVSRFDLSAVRRVNAGQEVAKKLVQYVKADGASGAFIIRFGKADDPSAKDDSTMQAVVGEFAKQLGEIICWDVTNNRVVPLCTNSLEELGHGFTNDDLAGTRMAATMTSMGVTYQPSRADLASLPTVDRNQVRKAQRCLRRVLDNVHAMNRAALDKWRLAELDRWRRWLERLVQAGELIDQVSVPASELGHMGALLCESAGRDAAIALLLNIPPGIERESAEGPAVDWMFECLKSPVIEPDQRYVDAAPRLFQLVAAHLATARRACAFSVWAWFSWWHSDGARAEVLAEAALDLPDPPPLAGLIRDLARTGTLPQVIRFSTARIHSREEQPVG